MEPLSTTTTTASSSSSSGGSNVTLIELRRSLVPPKWEETVRPVAMSECREAALSLAYAFAADEYAQYLVDPGDVSDGAAISAEDKWRLHADIMTYAVAAHCLSGLATTTGPDHDCVALWLPPGKDLDGWLTLLRSGLWRLHWRLSPEGRRRYFDEILPLLHDTKAAVLGDRDADAWYLVYLGTRPRSQGRGYARRVLEDVMRKADAENRPMYLESSSLANNAYYARFGFQVKREIFLTRGRTPVRLSIMVREPVVGGSGVGAEVSACKAAHFLDSRPSDGKGGRLLMGAGKKKLAGVGMGIEAGGGWRVVGGGGSKLG